VSLGKALIGMYLPLSDLTGSNRWQVDQKTKNIPSLSPGQNTLTNSEQVSTLHGTDAIFE